LESITKRVNQIEERVWGTEDKVKEILYSDSNKAKIINKHEYDFQEFWDMIKKWNLRIQGTLEDKI
jgi:hypothetical protein